MNRTVSDLVERLRARAPYYTEWASDIRRLNGHSVDADHADATARDLREAADALERAERGRDEARAYLKQITLMAGPTIPRYENALNIIRDIKYGAAHVLFQAQGEGATTREQPR